MIFKRCTLTTGAASVAPFSFDITERAKMEIISFIAAHWLEWLFTAVLAVLSWLFKLMRDQLRQEQDRNKAIAEGVQSLLRESIVNAYNRYSDRGYCPIYAKESVKRVYQAYHGLGGNDVATELYNKLLKMPEERNEG